MRIIAKTFLVVVIAVGMLALYNNRRHSSEAFIDLEDKPDTVKANFLAQTFHFTLVDIRVNGQVLGNIENGQEKEFSFDAQSTNEVSIQQPYDGPSCSPVYRFPAKPGEHVHLVIEPTGSTNGYPIAIRENTSKDLGPQSLHQPTVEVVSTQWDPTVLTETVESFNQPIRKGDHLTFKHRAIRDARVEIVKTDMASATDSTTPSASLFLGPLELSLSHTFTRQSSSSLRKTQSTESATEDLQELNIVGTGSEVLITKKRHYRTGKARIRIDGKESTVFFREPISEFYVEGK